MKIVLCMSLALTILLPAVAWAYGPSVHIREADQYIVQCELHPGPYPVHNPELLRRQRAYLRLGAIWPDLANFIVGEVDGAVKGGKSHHPDFNRFLLDDALESFPDDPWKLAFAIGGLDHCTGDIVAQDMLTPHLSVRVHSGELDVLTGYDDNAPGGEMQAIIEGGLEFMVPRLDLYLVLTERFLLTMAGRQDLQEVIDYYLPLYQEYFPAEQPLDREQAFQRAVYYLAHLRELPPPEVSPALYLFAASGFSDSTACKGLGFDFDEFLRILPALLSDEFWQTYDGEGFAELSPTMLLTYEPGQPFFDTLPIWSAAAMKSGSIQSLAYYLPEQLAVEDGRFLLAQAWYADDNPTPITSIDAASPPAEVTLSLTFFDTPGRTADNESVQIRIREDSTAGTVVASDYVAVGVDPWTYDVAPLVTATVSFDPAASIAAGAAGFFVELANDDDPNALPYFTTNWSLYQQITEIDMTKDAYTLLYATYGQWPYSLQIIPVGVRP